MNDQVETITAEAREAEIAALGLKMECKLLDAGDWKSPAKWLCIISKEIPDKNRHTPDRIIVTVEFTKGAAFREWAVPKSKVVNGKRILSRWSQIPQRVAWKTLTGVERLKLKDSRPIPPGLTEVLWCLSSDWQCADGNSFEEFCAELGYNTDSIKDRDCYLACQESGAKLRKLGLDIERLRELYQDY